MDQACGAWIEYPGGLGQARRRAQDPIAETRHPGRRSQLTQNCRNAFVSGIIIVFDTGAYLIFFRISRHCDFDRSLPISALLSSMLSLRSASAATMLS